MPKRTSIANQLRKAILRAERRGISRYQIAKKADVSQSLLSAFMNDPDKDMQLGTAERIAAAIGQRLDLTERG